MKVGIITFHRAFNYGAVLQAYALCSKINTLNHHCEVIDYRNDKFEKEYKKVSVFTSKSVRDFISAMINGRIRNKKRDLFIEFITRKIKLSSKRYTEKNICEANQEYDLFVSGSDQVWNLELTGNDWNYYLDFVYPGKKKVSYAASMTKIANDKKSKDKIRKILNGYDYITLRETSGKEYLESLGIYNSEVAVDPTLLLTKQEWECFSRDYTMPENIPKRFLLAYFVSPTKLNYDQMKCLGEKLGLPVVLINYSHRKVRRVINLRTVSPEQFVKLISEATFVITNSFHGTAFSINLNKEFLYVLNTEKPEKNERILTLINALNLKNRDYSTADIRKGIDWKETNFRLKVMREKSMNILVNHLLV